MKKFLCRTLLSLAVVILAIAAIITAIGYNAYHKAIEEKPLAQAISEIREKDDYTPLSSLPKTYLDAIVAVEDHRFKQHGGVDIISLARAMWNNVTSLGLVEGGSTITQQLAKNMYFTNERSFIRKIAEAFMAVNIESVYSKEEILELYVNSIYFGDGYYCVKEASMGYFDKEPCEMSDSECTLLAGIPNAPSVYAPTVSPELAEKRQRHVIEQMVKYGYLTEEKEEEITSDLAA